MPYFGDRTLADVLRDGAELPRPGDVLRIGAVLADGLAHAHARGLLHLDLKPANILLADTGEPMLLDFNLAVDASEPLAGRGGTLAYLAPEHLDETRPATPGAGTDVYALGMILLELLTGRYPWTVESGDRATVLTRMKSQRNDVSSVVRQLPATISPATRSILTRALHPSPNDRYPTAAALAEDLRRQLDDRPLKFAPDHSLPERARKLCRRHRTAVLLFTATVLAVGTVSAGAYALHRNRLLDRADALQAIAELERSGETARLTLAAPSPDPSALREALAIAEASLVLVGASINRPDDGAWRRIDDPQARQQARLAAAELSLLMARGHRLRAQRGDTSAIGAATDANRLAEALFGKPTRWTVLQQAAMLGQVGKTDESEQLARAAPAASQDDARDAYFTAMAHAGNGKFTEAAEALRRVTELQPGDPGAWFLLSQCEAERGDREAALRAAEVACALDSGSSQLLHQLGVRHFELNRLEDAERAYTRAIALGKDSAVLHLDRAIVRLRRSALDGALSDVDRSLALDPTVTRAHFVRAAIFARRGDTATAEAARRAGIDATPNDEQSWVSRGVARLGQNPRDAVADFDEALKLNPSSISALQSKAHVVGERLGDASGAIEIMQRVVALRPAFAEGHSSLAVLRARLHRLDPAQGPAALADVQTALSLPATDGVVMYQAACVHAILAPAGVGSIERAFALLAGALTDGFGHDELPEDPDLANLRGDPRFATLLNFSRLPRR
jgi:tetratricopeptide (TPR) repeat protein